MVRTLSRNAKWLACEVQDIGSGISAEDQKLLFDVFFGAKRDNNQTHRAQA